MKVALFCLFLVFGAFLSAEAARIHQVKNDDLVQYRLSKTQQAVKPQTRGEGKLAVVVIRKALEESWHWLPEWVKYYFGIDKIMELVDKYTHFTDDIQEILEHAFYELSCETHEPGCSPNAAHHAAIIVMWLVPL